MEGMRILIASPLGDVVAEPIRATIESATVVVAHDRDEFVRSVFGRVRFDVVSADLIFNRPDAEWTFDGLDVLDGLGQADRLAPVLLATQGHSMETDHLEEARLRSDVWGVVAKADGFGPLVAALRTIAHGEKLADNTPSPRYPPLYELFTGRRGITAARMAGAIAAGNASDNATLASIAKVSPNTANKVTSHYLGPMMHERKEHDDRLTLTQASVYRWCGLHARYIVSWCRRHGHEDVLSPQA